MKYTLVLLCPRFAAGIWIASISAGVFAFNCSMYGVFAFLVSARKHLGQVDLKCNG